MIISTIMLVLLTVESEKSQTRGGV